MAEEHYLNPDLKNIWKHMKDFSFVVLGKAICDCTYNDMGRPFIHDLAVVNVAHGAEIMLKARIAQEHPLLIFDNLPKKSKTNTSHLSFNDLIEGGVSVRYSDLPDLLWAVTGYRMSEKHKQDLLKFGKYRNSIVHLGTTNINSDRVLAFALGTLDHLAYDLFNESFIEYVDIWDEVTVSEGYLKERIINMNINLHPATEELINSTEF